MLLTKTQGYLKSIGKSIADLPEKFTAVFASMEEYEAEYQALQPNERGQFDGFIADVDERLFTSIKAAEPKPVDIDKIIGEKLTDPASLAVLDAHIKALPQTKDLNSKGGDYTMTRKRLHNKILTELTKGNECITRTKPIAILTGGLPGSGKSRFIKKSANWLTNPAIFKIDVDEVRKMLPEYQGWNAAQTHEESSDLVKLLMKEMELPGCKYDIVYDGTMTNFAKYNALIQLLKKAGYQIFLVYLQTDLETSIQRVLERYKRSGRYVPLDVVRSIAAKGSGDFESLKAQADGWVLVDGNTADVLSTGGKELPKDRDYTKITDLGCESCEHESHDDHVRDLAFSAWENPTKHQKFYNEVFKKAKAVTAKGKTVTYGSFERAALDMDKDKVKQLTGKATQSNAAGKKLGKIGKELGKKQSLLDAAEALRTAAEFLDGDKQESMNEAAEALETAAEFL